MTNIEPITPTGKKVIHRTGDVVAIIIVGGIAVPVSFVFDILTYPLPTPAWGATKAVTDALGRLWHDLWN